MVALRSFYIYIILSYCLPVFYLIWLEDYFSERYVLSSLSILFLAANVSFVTLLISVRFFKIKHASRRFYIGKGFFLIFSISFLILSILFSLKYNISFRHTSRISDGGSLVYAIYLMRSLAVYAVLRMIINVTNGQAMRARDRLSVLLLALGLLSTTTSSLQVLEFFMALFALQAKTGFLNKRFGFTGAMKMLLPSLLILLLVVYFGVANKVGLRDAFFFVRDSGFELLKNSLLRVSTSFVSGSYASLSSVQNFLDFSVFEKNFSTFLYRAQLLMAPLHLEFEGDPINTVNRMNYLNISRETSLERAGASPGLIGSFLYLPFYPVSLFFAVLYVKLLVSRINCLFNYGATPSIFVSICILIFLRPLLESPLSIFVLIDPVFFTFLIAIIGPAFKGR